jgi:hypothetical protein
VRKNGDFREEKKDFPMPTKTSSAIEILTGPRDIGLKNGNSDCLQMAAARVLI